MSALQTAAEVRHYALEHLDYKPETGVIVWKKATKGHPEIFGRVAGTVRDKYRIIKLLGKAYRAHRIAWLIIHGEWPLLLDHVNRDCDDNRLSNLRVTTRLGNARNHTPKRKRSQTPPGVRKQGRNYTARITDQGRQICLGTFSSADQAGRAYREAQISIFGDHCPL